MADSMFGAGWSAPKMTSKTRDKGSTQVAAPAPAPAPVVAPAMTGPATYDAQVAAYNAQPAGHTDAFRPDAQAAARAGMNEAEYTPSSGYALDDPNNPVNSFSAQTPYYGGTGRYSQAELKAAWDKSAQYQRPNDGGSVADGPDWKAQDTRTYIDGDNNRENDYKVVQNPDGTYRDVPIMRHGWTREAATLMTMVAAPIGAGIAGVGAGAGAAGGAAGGAAEGGAAAGGMSGMDLAADAALGSGNNIFTAGSALGGAAGGAAGGGGTFNAAQDSQLASSQLGYDAATMGAGATSPAIASNGGSGLTGSDFQRYGKFLGQAGNAVSGMQGGGGGGGGSIVGPLKESDVRLDDDSLAKAYGLSSKAKKMPAASAHQPDMDDPIDANGATMASIQALTQRVHALRAQLEAA